MEPSGTALDSCTLCHTGSPSGSNLNSYANAYAANGYNFAAIEALDSDGDGFSNIAEINARTFPGDPASKPAASDTTPPTVTAFSIPATSSSLTVSITAFTATDNVGVTGYLVNESATKPTAAAGRLERDSTDELYLYDCRNQDPLRLGQGCRRKCLQRLQCLGHHHHHPD